jgi:hypothetical protein
MFLPLLLLYAGSAAIILALGRGLLMVLRHAGVESWAVGLVLAIILGILISPTMVAGHGVGILPWILAPGDLSWGIWMSPATCLVAWLAMGQPLAPTRTEVQQQSGRKPAPPAPL